VGFSLAPGQRQGAVLALCWGVWNGVLVLLVQPELPEELSDLPLYGLPVLQSLVGAIAGWMGSYIWQPMSPATVPGVSRQVLKAVKKQQTKLFAGPISWPRVIMGACLGVAGAISAGLVLQRIISISEYTLSPQSQLHAQVVTWEISSLAILAAGALAGATTRNGAKQGLATGMAISVILLGIRLSEPDPPSFFVLAASMFGPVVLGFMGGAFGSQLLPPVARPRKRGLDAA